MADHIRRRSLLMICVFIILVSCAGQMRSDKSPSGVYHRVKKGETLSNIAQAYKTSAKYLAGVNNLDNAKAVEAGAVLFIPDAKQVIDDVISLAKIAEGEGKKQPAYQMQKKPPIGISSPTLPKSGEIGKTAPAVKDRPISSSETSKSLPDKDSEIIHVPDKTIFPAMGPPQREKNKFQSGDQLSQPGQKKTSPRKKLFIWPVKGKIVSRFGIQPNGMRFNGIQIEAQGGAPVMASADGIIIFSGPLKDYGETIIVKHNDNYVTVYSNLGQRFVKRDENIKQGDRIAILMKSATKGGASINFEVRQNNQAMNPLLFLP